MSARWIRAASVCALGLVLLAVITPAAADIDLAEIARRVQAAAAEEAALAAQRETAAREREQRQAKLEAEARARRDAAEARSVELDQAWQDNEETVAQLGELLRQHQGNLGELFGVTRQVAGDAANVLQQSLLSPRFESTDGRPERDEFLRRLADAGTLPSIDELQRFWFEIHRELTATGEVVRYRAPVLQAGTLKPDRLEVLSIGPFLAASGSDAVGYLPGEQVFTALEGRLPQELREVIARFGRAERGYAAGVVDPARGALVGLHLTRPDLMERLHHGALVGYVIVAVGIAGMVAAVFQTGYLLWVRLAVSRQLRNLARPRAANPLGRVLLAVDDPHAAANPDLAKLLVSEAVLHEIPRLERFQAFLRLAVGAGPLLGLIGTVIGMILTFKAITASGSSDPRLMAEGIGQAMVATVLGLGIAIPLLFANAGLSRLSGALARTLSEQGNLRLAVLSGAGHRPDP